MCWTPLTTPINKGKLDLIGNLSNLNFLEIVNNQLSSLPESIGNLSKLSLLVLGEYPINEVEKERKNKEFIAKL